MPLFIDLTEQGIGFKISADRKPFDFPINANRRTLTSFFQSEESQRVFAIERLYYEGLIDRKSPGEYILPFDHAHDLDNDTWDELGIPVREVNISVKEDGHLTTEHYHIGYEAQFGARTLHTIKRTGPLISSGNNHYLLTKDQWRLVDEIERWQDSGKSDTLSRARHQAWIKKLSQKAGAAIDTFMASRDSEFVDHVDIDIEKIDDEHLRFKPELEDLPTELRNSFFDSISQPDSTSADKRLNGKLKPVVETRIGANRKRFFLNPEVKDKIGSIQQMPEIKGRDVPRFLDNPISYFPESIEYDPEAFAKRVKGLKIQRSTVVPYVSISVNPDRPGWFDLDQGVRIDPMEEPDLSNNIEKETDRLSDEDVKLIKERLESPDPDGPADDYIYSPTRHEWMQINRDAFSDFEKADQALKERGMKPGSFPMESMRKVLDIYTNLDNLEYNETFIQNKAAFGKILGTPFTPPAGLSVNLFDYQKVGYQWLQSLGETGMGGLLADDMGLGKTLQVIAYLLDRKNRDQLKPSLIVVPLTLIENWINEISRFAERLLPVCVYGGPSRRQFIGQLEQYDLVITSYETLARDQLLLARTKWKLIISDETQKIKNFKTQAAHAAKGMHAVQRVAMTGTPVENRLSELWSIIDFIQPGLLMNYGSFRKTYEIPIMQGESNAEELTQRLIDTVTAHAG